MAETVVTNLIPEAVVDPGQKRAATITDALKTHVVEAMSAKYAVGSLSFMDTSTNPMDFDQARIESFILVAPRTDQAAPTMQELLYEATRAIQQTAPSHADDDNLALLSNFDPKPNPTYEQPCVLVNIPSGVGGTESRVYVVTVTDEAEIKTVLGYVQPNAEGLISLEGLNLFRKALRAPAPQVDPEEFNPKYRPKL